LRAAYENNRDEGFMVLSVSTRESKQTITDFIARHGLTYPFLMDRDGSASLDFGVVSTPTTFFIGPDGAILDSKAGMISRDWLEGLIRESTST
jgi:peroxiredoxin|tara:strand:- start:910 stop:1188 length:279 start_codon:yes stop_codon:yes gene_type:complete